MLPVSVIMLTHNRKHLVGNMIADILAQTFRDFEFVIVDNGSSDGTDKLLADYALTDSRIRILTLPERTIGAGRNAGIKASKGEYVVFVDDDDHAENDYLQFLLELTENGRHDISLCGSSERDANGTVSPQCVFEECATITPEHAVRLLLERQKIRAGLWAKCFRRSLVARMPIEEHCQHEDIFITYKYLAEARSLRVHGLPKYCAVRHSANHSLFSSNPELWTPEKFDEYMRAFKERTAYIGKKLPALAAFARYAELSYMISMLEKIDRFNLTGCTSQKEKMLAELVADYDFFATSCHLKDFERRWLSKYVQI